MPGTTIKLETDPLQEALNLEAARLLAEKAAAYDRVLRHPTIKNRKALGAAEKALADFSQALNEPETGGVIFSGVLEALAYLEEDHWKVGKTKLYDDFNSGNLRAQPDGTFLLASVQEYARIFLKKEDGTPGGVAGLPSLQEQKIIEDTLRIRADRQQRELKLKEATGELIRKSDVEIEFSKRIVYLKSDRKSVWRANAVEIIRLIGGDPQKAAVLIDFGCRMEDEIMDRYSRPLKGFGDD